MLPSHLLPETDASAFTYLIDRYFRERTRLTLSATASAGAGPAQRTRRLCRAGNDPAGCDTPSGTGQSTTYQYSGTMPSATQYVVFGARVGMEGCDLVGAQPAEFLLADFIPGCRQRLHSQPRITFQNLLDKRGSFACSPSPCAVPDPVAQWPAICRLRSRNWPGDADKFRLQCL